jgi:hypothetical protein
MRKENRTTLIPKPNKDLNKAENCKIETEIFNTALERSKRDRGGVFTIVDISKAFDTVPHSAITPSLARKGIPAPLIELINKMYRRVKTKIKTRDGNGVEIEILRGVKQGDPLSPTLFNLCMEPLLEAVEESTEGININNNNKIPISAFADDIVLIGKDKQEAQKQLTMIAEYLEGLGMNISGDKSQTFQVISKQDTWYVDDKLAIKIKNIKIPNIAPEDAFRYLGAKMGPWKGLKSGITVPELMGTIKRVRKLSLKPGQKIELLQKYILPRYIFNLLISPPVT